MRSALEERGWLAAAYLFCGTGGFGFHLSFHGNRLSPLRPTGDGKRQQKHPKDDNGAATCTYRRWQVAHGSEGRGIFGRLRDQLF